MFTQGITQFVLYKFLFMTELLTAEYLFTHRLKKRSLFWVRYIFVIAACYLLVFFFSLQPINAAVLDLIFFTLFLATLLGHLFCYDESFVNILFCLTASYIVQHIAYQISNSLLVLTGLNADCFGVYSEEVVALDTMAASIAFGYILTFFVYYVLYYIAFLFYGSRIKKNMTIELQKLPLLVISLVTFAISIVVNSFLVFYITSKIIIIISSLYTALSCCLIFYILFGMMSSTRIRHELDTIYKLLRESQKQFEFSKETIDLINLKCHDLKHQIRLIGESSAAAINKDALREIIDTVSVYDTKVKTGNETLDTIITEKSLFCYKNKIKLTCLADGKSLSFLNEAELCGLFGNAIDNAIMAVKDLAEEDKRYIGVTIRHVKGFVSVNLHNCYEQKIEFDDDGFPISTKQNKANHGFGTKSIAYIVARHGGKLSFVAKDGIFNVNIIFPDSGIAPAAND